MTVFDLARWKCNRIKESCQIYFIIEHSKYIFVLLASLCYKLFPVAWGWVTIFLDWFYIFPERKSKAYFTINWFNNRSIHLAHLTKSLKLKFVHSSPNKIQEALDRTERNVCLQIKVTLNEQKVFHSYLQGFKLCSFTTKFKIFTLIQAS